MTQLIAAPLLLALASALAGPLWGRRTRPRRWFMGAAATVQLLINSILYWHVLRHETLVMHVGGWSPQLGIELVLDPLSGLLLVLTSAATLAALLHAFAATPSQREHPLRLSLVQFLAAGVHLCLITGDLFNLFVALEITLASSFALLTLEADNRTIRHTLPYVAMNLFGSALILAATALTYGMFGTLNFAELAARSQELADPTRITWLALLFIAAFGLKTAIGPLFFWLPYTYPVLPYPLIAVFAATLTKVGAYSLIRIFAGILPAELELPHAVLRGVAVLTLLIGAIGALTRDSLRGLFSFLLVGHLGFVVLALGLFTRESITAAVFYLAHEIPSIAALFMLGSAMTALTRSDQLAQGGGLWRSAPWVAGAFFCQMLSFSGVPPFSGFWGKLMIVSESLAVGATLAVVAALVASALTLVALLKVWLAAVWHSRSSTAASPHPRWRSLAWSGGALTLVSIGIGLGAEYVWQAADTATTVLLNRESTTEVIIGSIRPPETFPSR